MMEKIIRDNTYNFSTEHSKLIDLILLLHDKDSGFIATPNKIQIQLTNEKSYVWNTDIVVSHACITAIMHDDKSIIEQLSQNKEHVSRFIKTVSAKILEVLTRLLNVKTDNIKLLFALGDFNRDDIESSITDELTLEFCKKHVIFMSEYKNIEFLRKNIFIETDNVNNDTCIEKYMRRVAPWYFSVNNTDSTTQISGQDNIQIQTNTVAGTRNSQKTLDKLHSRFRLDEKQMDYLDKMQNGNTLILSCAGSGKTTLLAAKAIWCASVNKDKKYLLSCYNKQLSKEHGKYVSHISGELDNLQCVTFYGLVYGLIKKLKKEHKISINIDDDDYKGMFEIVKNAIDSKLICCEYDGIFIDEVQALQPEWYEFYYKLLKKPKEDNIFVIAGDKSQSLKMYDKKDNTKSTIRQTNTGFLWPWELDETQKKSGLLPDFDSKSGNGRIIKIVTNYRCSEEISEFIRKFSEVSIDKIKSLTPSVAIPEDLFLQGTSKRHSNKVIYKEVTHRYKKLNHTAEAKMIYEIVADWKKRGICKSDSDIAILTYKRTFANLTSDDLWNALKYEFTYKHAINLDFYNNNSVVFKYPNIAVKSVDGSLGTDRKCVILAGLNFIGKSEGIAYEKDFNNCINDINCDNNELLFKFLQCTNSIYAGCSRAIENLAIVMSVEEQYDKESKMYKPDNSLFRNIIKQAAK